jgi:dienelactone hydrolase
MNSSQQAPVKAINRCVRIHADDVYLLGDLQIPEESTSLVIFAYNCGRSRNNPRNRHAAQLMRSQGIGTLMCELMTEEEEVEDEACQTYRYDAELLARRLIAVTKWVEGESDLNHLRIGYFGACSGGAAAVIAAARLGDRIGALVSRGGRMDLAVDFLPQVTCPTLLIVGGEDTVGMQLNREAMRRLRGEKSLHEVAGASHLFGEPGKLEEMARISADWFHLHLSDPSKLDSRYRGTAAEPLAV